MNLEERAVTDLAVLYMAEIESNAPLLEYAVITCLIRHHLKGVSREFLIDALRDLSNAEFITIDPHDEFNN